MAKFEFNLEENLLALNKILETETWKPDPYVRFLVSDPKPRVIHKASVRDRVLFQAVYQQLYQVFDKTFIHDSYASRNGKGTHAGVRRFGVFARKISQNYIKNAWILKCDVRKFFDNIDHEILITLVSRRIKDQRLLELTRQIIDSFETNHGRGLPLGNVTSQLFANIYLNELDQFAKHILKAKYYIRYCDDFVILHESHEFLMANLLEISNFLKTKLKLNLHPNKIHLRKFIQGVDFLGYVSLPHYRVLRTRTKQRMLKRLSVLADRIKTKDDYSNSLPTIKSYLGMLSHCRGNTIKQQITNLFNKWIA